MMHIAKKYVFVEKEIDEVSRKSRNQTEDIALPDRHRCLRRIRVRAAKSRALGATGLFGTIISKPLLYRIILYIFMNFYKYLNCEKT